MKDGPNNFASLGEFCGTRSRPVHQLSGKSGDISVARWVEHSFRHGKRERHGIESKTTKTKAKKTTARTRSSATKISRKKVAKSKTNARKGINAKRATSPSRKNKARNKTKLVGLDALEAKRARGRSGRQAGDLQGLSRKESADSQSVVDLLEEGNTFEAEAVQGVEDAKRPDVSEVTTRQVPEDDVPGEYLDQDDNVA